MVKVRSRYCTEVRTFVLYQALVKPLASRLSQCSRGSIYYECRRATNPPKKRISGLARSCLALMDGYDFHKLTRKLAHTGSQNVATRCAQPHCSRFALTVWNYTGLGTIESAR